MKLCITAAGNDLNAATDAAFGRAPWFVLIDIESGTTQGIENSNSQASQGAGIAAAQTMSEHGVDAVLTGRLGPKAKAALEASGVGMYEGLEKSTVAEALEQFRAGEYGAYNQAETDTPASPSPASESSNARQCSGPGATRSQGGGYGMGQGQGRGQGQGKGGCGCGKGTGTGNGQGRRRGQ
ncbi:MAG: NifB/NifX family molybdenum-iron cluster-binding protein [Candidatus Electrothrix aestuarii]|uniref:NifB/NifX family molybdenum-iron cluster-binding protein n=1 Tax=Candidatus Electrothrix aestuarii TaxID=3062594 RepID=A0AAU8LR72_9BACT|nr:NifB/NifX family molybdenum-iron cluster-binding protein [Candidatus Electrothrix aestuarii]